MENFMSWFLCSKLLQRDFCDNIFVFCFRDELFLKKKFWFCDEFYDRIRCIHVMNHYGSHTKIVMRFFVVFFCILNWVPNSFLLLL